YLKGGASARALKTALRGRSFIVARRIGKQLLLDTSGDGPVLGLHFGMAGGVLVAGRGAAPRLRAACNDAVANGDGLAVRFAHCRCHRELRRRHRHRRKTRQDLLNRGGSHTGDLTPERAAAGVCPKDGAPLVRDRVGGRTTWWCPVHQT